MFITNEKQAFSHISAYFIHTIIILKVLYNYFNNHLPAWKNVNHIKHDLYMTVE